LITASSIEPLRDAPRGAEPHAVDQRLQLDQERSAALARDRDDAAGGRLRRARQKNRRRILHLFQAGAGHGEEAELVDRPETILGGAHDAVAAAGLALEVQDGVDQVLEQLRPRDRTLLGHVTDDDDRRTPGLGEAHQLRGALAQLRHRPGAGRHAPRLQRLDRVDDEERRLPRCRKREDRLAVGFGHDAESRGSHTQAPGAQSHLRHRLLATRVDYRVRGGHVGRHLQQERRLADSRISPQQDHRTRHDPAPQDPVELRLPARQPLAVAEGGPRSQTHRRGGRRGAGCGRTALLERVPLTAQRTLPLPLEGLAPAGGAHEHRIQASHLCEVGRLSARIRAGEIT
jgi:hypothetical protein